jgi:putative flippase GtrA
MRFVNRQFRNFLLAGGTAAAANFGSRFLFSLWVSYAWAVLLAYGVGMTVGFVLMRSYVFDARGGAVAPQLAKFVAINLIAVAQTFAISLALARWILPAVRLESLAEAVGHLAGVAAPVVTSYFGHRLLTFKG